MAEEEVGKVVKYFSHVNAAIVEITAGGLKEGERIAIRGHTTDIEQVVASMQVEHEVVETASRGQTVGIEVKERVRPGDTVYKLGVD